jgi:predicted DNA-binding protein
MPAAKPVKERLPDPISVRFPAEELERLRELAEKDQRTVAGLLRVLVTDYLNKIDDAEKAKKGK